MALKAHFSSLSFGASVDQQTGNLSIFDLIEELRVPQVPIHLQSMVIALSFEKKEAEAFQGKLLIHFLTPDGRQQMVGTGEIQVPADQKRMKALFRFGGFPIQQFGTHRFVLSWLNSAGTKVGEELLDFDVIQAAQVAQGVGPTEGEKPGFQH